MGTKVHRAADPGSRPGRLAGGQLACLELSPWGAMEQWMQLRLIVRGIGHRAATIWASSTATLFVLFAAATGTAFVSTGFGCLQPDCLAAEGAAIQSPQQSLALGQDGI